MTTAAEYAALAASTAAETARIEAATNRLPFDLNEPLPPLKPHPRTHSWEPAARRYRDIDETEKREQA